ncbi:MAG: Dabb family protein [Clostridia bacterium]|nr:Dabb family protein [Clostridia bacterium]
MVVHIVMWNLKEEAAGNPKAENARLIKEKLEALQPQIDGVLKMEVGVNYNPKGMDLCLYSEFRDEQAQADYQVHPLHQEVRKFVHQVIESRVVVDYVR